ncbi:hypothetical protein SynMEDNS5_02693 [Synechococcus sp. MEDNS5]|nr:hypothetical protein SynMEDNS5_02693 [Synechococcus sp. MEDNS5]
MFPALLSQRLAPSPLPSARQEPRARTSKQWMTLSDVL